MFRSTNHMNVPSYVVYGRQALTSGIPVVGDPLNKLMEFRFKSLGVSSDINKTDRELTNALVYVCGLGACLQLPMGCLWRNSSICQMASSLASLVPIYSTPFQTVQLLKITFELYPTSQVGSRQGEWAMAFVPRYAPYNTSHLVDPVPSFNAVCRLPGAISGPATSSIKLSYSTSGNRFLQMYHQQEEIIGQLDIAYQDDNRDRMIEFTAAEIAPKLVISVELRPGAMAISNVSVVSDVVDQLQFTAMTIMKDDGSFGLQLKPNGFKATSDDRGVRVTGAVSSVVNLDNIRQGGVELH